MSTSRVRRSSLQAQAMAGFCPDTAAERVIFLLDYDSFFARCLQQAYPPLRGKPIGVRSPGCGMFVIAASTEAKVHGIAAGMPVREALQRCPSLTLVRSDMEMHTEMCIASLRVLTRYTPLVEPFSIDEAFIDATALVREFGDAHMLAQQIKRDLRAALGPEITCSIGIGPNKMLAKLVSHFDKPDGITHVRPEEVGELLRHVALTDICGIGARVLRRLQSLGVYTVEQMGRIPRAALVREFGVLGHLYWLWGQGIDLSPVNPMAQQADEKSMGHIVTLPTPLTSREEFDAVLLRQCERLGRRLREREFLARTVQLTVAYDRSPLRPDAGGFGGRRTLPTPTNETQTIYAAMQSWVPSPALPLPVRQVSIHVSNLCRDALQLSLFDDRLRQRLIQRTMDRINDRYGTATLARAVTLHSRQPLTDGPPVNGLRKRYEV